MYNFMCITYLRTYVIIFEWNGLSPVLSFSWLRSRLTLSMTQTVDTMLVACLLCVTHVLTA